MKFRLGQVSPGTEENHLEHTPNCSASAASTGTWLGGWQPMISPPRSVIGLAAARRRYHQFARGASSPSKVGGASPRPCPS
jgi:hypothetical protein